MTETYLSNASFQKIEAALLAERQRRNTDRYYGLTLRTADELEKTLKNEFFAIRRTERSVKAIIFDTQTECDFHCRLAPEYKAMNFDQFKEVAGNSWRYPDCYYPQKGSNAIIFFYEW